MNVLEAQNITKIFPGVVALDSVDISFRLGEIHCIVGENGAGKSTLIKCLTGVYEPENGEININGKPALKNKKLFKRIAYVPQEIDLFNYMSVAENLFMPFENSGIRGAIHQKELQQKALPILEKFNIQIRPETLVKDISVSSRQLLQIARATAFEDYDVLMLDEPTTSLTTKDTEQLYNIIKQLKKENKAVIFISHKLEEIFAIGDYITVFCNGKKVSGACLKEVDIPWVVNQMTGRLLDQNESFVSSKVSDEVMLEVNHLSGAGFTDISFELKKGEILGFAGLVGSGRSELLQGVFGYRGVYAGSVKCSGKKWKLGDTNYSVKHGMFYLTEERRSQGILANLSIRENLSINSLDELKNKIMVSKRKEEKLANDAVSTYNIKTSNLEKEIKFLSGGNQQKVIIGRTMSCNPNILIFDEPTKGIDVGAKVEIYNLMKKLAEQGIGIILISSEMNEIIKCSNRIICLYKGRKAGEYKGGTAREDILGSILGLKAADAEVAGI